MKTYKKIRQHGTTIKCIVLFFIGHFLSAQTTVTGKVAQQTSSALEFANVLLLNDQDSTLFNGTVSDKQGSFELKNIKPGNYLIEASMIGYETYLSSVKIDNEKEELNLGIITLSESATLLENVTVTARKVLFEKKADRTVINVQSNAINKGNTVLNILRSSPGLMVGTDEIVMAGKQGVRIMINGKIVRMPLPGLMRMLEGMSASNVESIELITNPGAQFEAEGNAGYIDIVLLDSPERGWSANVGATTGMNQGLNAGANAGLQYRGNKLALNASYAFSYNDNQHIWDVYQSQSKDGFLAFSDAKTKRNSKILGQNMNFGMTYQLSSKTEFSIELLGVQNLHRQRDINTANIAHSADSSLTMMTKIKEPNNWLTGTTSIGLHHMLSESSKVRIFYDHLRYHNQQEADYNLEFTNNDSPQIINSELNTKKTTPIQFNVFSADYETDLNPDLSISSGGRIALSEFANEVDVILAGFPIYDTGAIQPKTYLSENIYAAYSQFTYNANSKLNFVGGLRYEHTSTDIQDANLESVVIRNYGNWFPTANLTYKIQENSSLQVVFNRRITRPTFNDLAPFVFFQNPSTLVQGNSELLPAIMNALDFTFTKGKHWITFQYVHTNNFISFFTPELNESNNVTYSTQNLDLMQMFALNLNPNIKFSSWWNSNNSISYQFFSIEDERSGQILSRKVNNVLINSNHSFQIRESLSANVAFNYNHSGFIGLVEFEPQWMANAGVSKRLKNGSNISLRLTDIFATYNWEGSFDQGNGSQSFLFDQNLRAVDVSWSMPLGNSKLKSVKVENGSANERARVN